MPLTFSPVSATDGTTVIATAYSPITSHDIADRECGGNHSHRAPPRFHNGRYSIVVFITTVAVLYLLCSETLVLCLASRGSSVPSRLTILNNVDRVKLFFIRYRDHLEPYAEGTHRKSWYWSSCTGGTRIIGILKHHTNVETGWIGPAIAREISLKPRCLDLSHVQEIIVRGLFWFVALPNGPSDENFRRSLALLQLDQNLKLFGTKLRDFLVRRARWLERYSFGPSYDELYGKDYLTYMNHVISQSNFC